jgi:hypothetical protein
MAILRTSDLAVRRLRAVMADGGRQERYGAREDARAVAAMMRKLERPRYDEALPEKNPTLVDKLVLVFERGPLVEVIVPPLDLAAPRPLLWAPPESEEAKERRAMKKKAQARELQEAIRQAARFGLSVAMTDDEIMEPTVDAYGRRVLVDGLEPILDPEECALAAYRALIDGPAAGDNDPTPSRAHVDADWEARLRQQERPLGDYGPVQTWAVITEEDGRKVHRLYVGTEGALRRTFPDLYERERMVAAGVLGAVEYAPGEPMTTPDGHVREGAVLEPAGYRLPAAPLLVRRRGYGRAEP